MTDTDKSELIELFQANYLDGDAIQQGQMVSSTVVKEFIADFVEPLITQQCNQAMIDGEQIGAFMAGSSILNQMSPLMVHRLEADFPSMTAEVIGDTYDEVKKQMKPFMDKRKAELQAKETEKQ